MKILLFSTLYPSATRPIHGIFVETRLRELLKSGEVSAKVIAPVPWFPFSSEFWGEYGRFARTPLKEVRDGIEIYHPRYPLLPKVGMNMAPWSLALCAWPILQGLRRDGFDFDLIDAHYYYPDGVAAALLANWSDRPFVVTARGTDLNLIPNYPRPRARILKTAEQAAASIGVCSALMQTLEQLGADPAKLHTLRNGVDLEKFCPKDRGEARRRLGLSVSGRYLLSVGHLIPRKGHDIAIAALSGMPSDVNLLIAGEGPERAALQRQAESLGLAERVRFLGMVPQADLTWWYSAADQLVLCSDREGWANVLLEAMACGTPVIASNIWGTPEVVSSPAAGVLMPERSREGLISAWHTLQAALPDRQAIRSHAERFSWDATTQGQLSLFRAVCRSPRTAINGSDHTQLS
ncbi:MAG: glycosyltransferase family 4 protein [Paucibacter sp.]|nr:glycosyltransferase family 4 protein [Roseateles sp.]